MADSGESAADAAIHELREELAVEIDIHRSLGTAAFVDPAINQVFHYEWFLATIQQGQPTILEPEKFDAWQFVAWPEIPTLRAISPNVVNFLAHYPTAATFQTDNQLQTWSVRTGLLRNGA